MPMRFGTMRAAPTTFAGTVSLVMALTASGVGLCAEPDNRPEGSQVNAAARTKGEVPPERAARGPVTEEEALVLLEAHREFNSFHPVFGWKDDDVDLVGRRALAIAEQFRGTDIGARALMLAAKATSGRCDVSPGPDSEGWDRAIALYQRVANEYPDTEHAAQTRWLSATCHGNWAWAHCCRDNQGKRDWPKATEAYQELYENATDSGSKCEALRRIAEIQFHCQGRWQVGLATYRRVLTEFPESPAPSPYRTNRTCAPFRGTAGIECDVVVNTGPVSQHTHRALMAGAGTAAEAVRLREEFVGRAPEMDSIRFHTLLQLEGALRRLGDRERADDIKAKLGVCDTWLVVGPFFDQDHTAVFGPEEDFLAGKTELSKSYRAATRDGRTGQAMWVRATSITRGEVWEVGEWNNCTAVGTFYALSYANAAKAQRAQLRVGCSGPVVAWMNGEEVLATDAGVVPEPVLDQHVVPLGLEAGRNQLFIRLGGNVNPHFLGENFLRITDERGVALQDVDYWVPSVPDGNKQRSNFLRQWTRASGRREEPEEPAMTRGKAQEVVIENGLSAIEEAAEMLPSCRQEGRWSHEYDSGRSYIRHHLFAMRVAGWDVDYETVMSVSGSGLSFAYQHDNYRVKYSDEELGIDGRVARATGFGYEWVPCSDASEAWEILKETIDSGRLARGEYFELVSFAGYQEADQKEDRKVLAIDPVFVWPAEWWGWAEFEKWWKDWAAPFRPAIGRHAGRVERTSARETAIRVMTDIVVWARSDPRTQSNPKAKFGLAGIEAYATDTSDPSKGKEYFGDLGGPWQGCHAVLPQVHARWCTQAYLRRVAGEFSGEARRHVQRAADKYADAFTAWEEWAEHLHRDASEEGRNWQSSEHRSAGGAAVYKALEHEKAAIVEIEKALALRK